MYVRKTKGARQLGVCSAIYGLALVCLPKSKKPICKMSEN